MCKKKKKSKLDLPGWAAHLTVIYVSYVNNTSSGRDSVPISWFTDRPRRCYDGAEIGLSLARCPQTCETHTGRGTTHYDDESEGRALSLDRSQKNRYLWNQMARNPSPTSVCVPLDETSRSFDIGVRIAGWVNADSYSPSTSNIRRYNGAKTSAPPRESSECMNDMYDRNTQM